MADSVRYTFARAFATEAAARTAWQAAARAATARPDNISVTRLLTPEGQHVVALVARRRPEAARPLERLRVRAPGSLPVLLDSGAADALHAHRDAEAPPELPPGAWVRKERRRPSLAQGVPLPYHPTGRPEPGSPPPAGPRSTREER
jgi:hypothetical protein